MSDKNTDLFAEAVEELQEIGFEAETPHRVSYFSLDPEESPVDSAPTASYVSHTDSVGINKAKQGNNESIDTASSTAHELVHYNLTEQMFGETSEDFRDEVDELIEAREAFVMIADSNGYDIRHDPDLGKQNRLNPLHLDAIALVTEDLDDLNEIMSENSPDDSLPLREIANEADGLLQEHYPQISSRIENVYESGILPYQEPFAYFAELQISGDIDEAVQSNTTRNLALGFRNVIEKDFDIKPGRYFGSKNKEEVVAEVSNIFGGLLSQYQDLVQDGYNTDEAAEEVLSYSKGLG